MLPLAPLLLALLLSLGTVLVIDIIVTHLRRRARRAAHASEAKSTEVTNNGSTD